MPSVDPSTSRFTAVNSVKELTPNTPSTVVTSGNPSNAVRSESEKITPTQEKLTLITNYPDQEETSPSSNAGDRTLGPLPESRADEENLYKRKRSTSKCINSYYNSSLSADTRNMLGTIPTNSDLPRDENSRPQVPVIDSRDMSLENQFKQYPSPAEEHGPPTHNTTTPWNLSQASQPVHPTSDDVVETNVLLRVSQTRNHPPTHQHSKSPRIDRNVKAHPPLEMKKRKRNFSNRTKTGCMTCRKRKKKCDETKPECNNCLRGGFVCTGYQHRGSLSKQDPNALPPLPLQSKSEYEIHSSSYPTSAQYLSPTTGGQLFREPLPGYRGQTLRIDSQQNHHLVVESGHQSSISCYPPSTINTYHVHADPCLSSIPLFQQIPTPITATNSADPDRNVKNIFDRVIPPTHLNRRESRIEPRSTSPQSTSSPSIPQPFQSPRHVDPQKNPQIAAQLALSSLATTSNSCPSKVDHHGATSTQKEAMLAGHHYFPWDKQLVLERENCKSACWRFNNSSNPNMGVSFEERARLFRDILYPRQVGDDVIVDAPFNCDYGYNIIIGQDVMIGRNCTIIDTCEVHIGDRCHLGPNVNIYTTSLPIEPKKRLGSKGPQLGTKVIIESDCWIGGGVIILPGRTIGKGATIGAGSVVTRDIPPHTIARGNPAHVLRGISESE